MGRFFTIIGAGGGRPADFTRQAKEAMAQAGLRLAPGDLAAGLAGTWPIQSCPEDQLAEAALKADAARVCILTPGDPGFSDLAGRLREHLAGHGEIEVLCGLNAMQLLCARLGPACGDVLSVSRVESLLGAVSYHHKVFIQTDTDVCRILIDADLEWVRVACFQDAEHILRGTAAELAGTHGGAAAWLIENDRPGNPDRPVLDNVPEADGMGAIRQEVRWMAANLLDLRETDTVYDIGADTGAMAAELSRRVRRGVVYAVGQDAECRALLRHHRAELGCWNVLPVEGETMEAIQGLPQPNAAFFSGGGALFETLSALKERNPGIRVVLAAASLDALSDAQIALSTLGFTHITVCQAGVVRGHKEDSMTPLRMNPPVFLLSGGAR